MRTVNQDYQQMMRIHAKMKRYERENMGTPSLALQHELNELLAPYADRHKAERNPSDIDWPIKTA